MFWEFFHTIAEEAGKYGYQRPLAGSITPRQQAAFNSKFSRGMISIAALWLLSSGVIVRLMAFLHLGTVGILANAILIFAAFLMLYSLWKYPYLASRMLLRLGGIIIVASSVVFFSILFSLPPKSSLVLSPIFFWPFMMLIPSSLICLMMIFISRKVIYVPKVIPQDTPEEGLMEAAQESDDVEEKWE